MMARSPVWNLGSMLTPCVVTSVTSPVANATMTTTPATVDEGGADASQPSPAHGPSPRWDGAGRLAARTTPIRIPSPQCTAMSVAVMAEPTRLRPLQT